MSRILFDLTPDQRQELLTVRDQDPRPSLRERAAALLKIDAGVSANQVAATGLLKPRPQRTVSTWVTRYQEDGLPGLVAKPRGHRGFSPCAGRRRPASGSDGPPPLRRTAQHLAPAGLG